MFLKRRFSKAASRKGKTAYKFKFTFELANLTGIPANVHHAALTFVRGAKTQTSAVAPVEECAAVWHDARSSRLEFVATLYKDASGAFQTKQYALKAQGVTGAVDGAVVTAATQTFAKSVLDLRRRRWTGPGSSRRRAPVRASGIVHQGMPAPSPA